MLSGSDNRHASGVLLAAVGAALSGSTGCFWCHGKMQSQCLSSVSCLAVKLH